MIEYNVGKYYKLHDTKANLKTKEQNLICQMSPEFYAVAINFAIWQTMPTVLSYWRDQHRRNSNF